MTTLTTDRSHSPAPLLADGVAGKLRRLRRALRSRLLAEGIAWLVVALAGLVLTTLALDYLLRLDRPQRALVMAAAVVGVLFVIWRQVICPLRASMGQDALALLIERRYPHLQSRLISAVQFAAGGVPPGASPAMIARMADEANQLAGELDFSPVVERTSMWRVVKIALCSAALLAGLTVWQGDLMKLWAMRNLALAEVPWPQKTYLAVEGGPDYPVLRGDDLVVSVAVDRDSIAPSYITLHARYPSVGWTEDRIQPVAGDSRRFDIVFRSVSEPLEFYVVGGDDRRDKQRPHNVTLVDPPALRNVAFTVEYPSYMQREPMDIDGTGGLVVVPVGGVVKIDAIATKDIESASVSLVGEGDEVSVDLRIEGLTQRGRAGEMPRRLLGRLDITGGNASEVRTLQFHLTDSDGYGNRRGGRYFLRIQPDLEPGVDMKKTGIGSAVTPNAIVPLLISGTDDSGIAGGRVRLSNTRGQAVVFAQPLDIVPGPDGLRKFSLGHELDLAGLGLLPGDQIAIVAEVTDILPAELGGPNVGESGTVSLRIIERDKLMDELVKRQKAVREEFMGALKQQEDARSKTAAAGEDLAANSAVTPESLAKLGDSAGQQRSVSTEVSRAAEKLSAVLTEMTYNRLGDPADRQDLQTGIIEPLREIYEGSEKVAADLAEARELVDAGTMQAAAERIADDQQDLKMRIENVLTRMEKLQSRQDLANKLQTIIRWADKTLTDILEREKQEVINIWDR